MTTHHTSVIAVFPIREGVEAWCGNACCAERVRSEPRQGARSDQEDEARFSTTVNQLTAQIVCKKRDTDSTDAADHADLPAALCGSMPIVETDRLDHSEICDRTCIISLPRAALMILPRAH